MFFHSVMALPGTNPSEGQSHNHAFLQACTNPYSSFKMRYLFSFPTKTFAVL